jgi:hypothetical protein
VANTRLEIAVVSEVMACGLDSNVSEEPAGSIFGVETSVYIYGKVGHSVTSQYTIFTSRPKVISHLDVTNRIEGGKNRVFLGQLSNFWGPGSVVGIATGYGLDGPGIHSRWGGENFCVCPDRPWGPLSLLYNGYWVFPGGKEWPRRDSDPSPPSSAMVMEG